MKRTPKLLSPHLPSLLLYFLSSFFLLLSCKLQSSRMSPTLTAGTRLKTKSSGLSDFFGGNGLHSNPARHSPKQAPVAPSSPELAQRVESSSSSVKSKKSHIPFWGRRKGGNIQSLSPSKHKLTNNVPPSPPPPLPRPSGSSGTYSKNE